jgi:hypothetical protein
MTTRIYKITPKREGAAARFVRATHPAVALRHVADDAFTVRVATQDDLVSGFERGAKVEDIKAEQQELPAT